jgi:hypothetical protein
MDSTYKCNKWKMPLFNIVGVTATGHTFNAAFAFISQEKQANFVWVLQQFSKAIGDLQIKVWILIDALGYRHGP